MNCPVCDEKLREVERHGVQVDVCPSCKGVWLDRGELDKILDVAASDGMRSDSASAEVASARPFERGRDDHDHEHQDDNNHHDGDHGSIGRREGGGQKRRGSWLGDILGGIGGD